MWRLFSKIEYGLRKRGSNYPRFAMPYKVTFCEYYNCLL
ncbi:hypothetical protein CHK_1337 [Christensenella hongkongensis]|uniref:Uncharacterized protein n=1 Tax=Christensenella hongkongensis TaxID=270498 RepID=A0A0M2NL28_9FIRM|nr:hypothetical protein CHK_1337 [Christensenella hongkongensis]